MAALFVALIHYPVTDRNGRIVTSAITSLDLHDIARSSRTYEVSAFFVVHPVLDQRDFATRVIAHWQTGYGRQFDSRRREALDLIRIVTNLDEAIVAAERIAGARPAIVYTSARAGAGMEQPATAPPTIVPTPVPACGQVETALSSASVEGETASVRARVGEETSTSPASSEQSQRSAPDTTLISYMEMRACLARADSPPMMLLFGTGFGMAPAMLERADLALPPVLGPGEYNHLSVRAAAGIILDRLRGH